MVKRASKSKTKKVSKESMDSKVNNATKEDVKSEEKKTETSKKGGSEKAKLSKEEELKMKVDTLQEKADETNDKYLRLYSEFDNFRKRTAKEKIELSKTASENLISELLPVIDDFERALKSSEESESCESMIEGLSLIFNKTKGILEREGLKAIEAMGQEFDTDFHEAITYIPAPSKDMKGKIVDEVEKGYLLGEKVIRYSKVVIGQ